MNPNTSNPVLPPTLQKKQTGIERLKADVYAAGPSTAIVLEFDRQADSSVTTCSHSVFIAGCYLFLKKQALGHGQFTPFCELHFPHKSLRQLQRRMALMDFLFSKAAPAIQTALGGYVGEIYLGDGQLTPDFKEFLARIVTSPDEELPFDERNAKAALFKLLDEEVNQDIAERVALNGQELTAARRAANGASTGGNPTPEKRALMPRHIARSVTNICQWFSARRRNGVYQGYRKFSPADEVKIINAICEIPKYARRNVLEALKEAVNDELKLSEVEREARRE